LKRTKKAGYPVEEVQWVAFPRRMAVDEFSVSAAASVPSTGKKRKVAAADD